MPKSAPPPNRPPRQLGFEPLIASRDDADVALAELAWIDNRKKDVDAATDERIKLVRLEMGRNLVVRVDDQDVPFADRRKALEDALLWFAQDHDAEIFAEKKTAAFDHGEIKKRKLPDAVGFAEGADEESVLLKIRERGGLSDVCDTLLGWITHTLRTVHVLLCGRKTVPADQLCEVKLSLSKSRILNGVKAGSLSLADLAELGLQITTGEKLEVKPKLEAVQSHSRERAA